MSAPETLIDKVEKKGISRYAISKATGIPDSTLCNIQAGKLGMSPKVAALVAELAEIDPREAALEAIVNSEKDVKKRERLAKLLHVSNWRKR